MRYLHFGTEWIQGGMRVSRPYALELAYQQEMMAPGLFLPEPRRIVQLGLGAAALTKFCYRNVPSADVVVVELSQEVIDAARGWFLLPDDDARLTVVHDDAKDFIAHPKQRGRADWLQVDLYDKHARGPVYDDVEFYRDLPRGAERDPESPASTCSVAVSIPVSSASARRSTIARWRCRKSTREIASSSPSTVPRLSVPIAALLDRAAELEDALALARASLGLRPALGERPGGRAFDLIHRGKPPRASLVQRKVA